MQRLKIASVFVTEYNITMDNIHVAAWKYLSASQILNAQNCEGGILVDGHEQANNLISLCCIKAYCPFPNTFQATALCLTMLDSTPLFIINNFF